MALAEAWLRDVAQGGVALLSLGVVLAGFAGADGAVPAVLGTVVGLVGVVMAFVPLVRHWSVGRSWLTYLAVLVVDAVTIVVLTRS